MLLQIRLKSKRSRRALRGVAAVEFALCMPILVLMTLATVEACNAIYLRQSLTIAAYEGARTAILPKVSAPSAVQQSNQILTDRRVQDASVTVTPNNIKDVKVGEFVTVSVSAPMSKNSMFLTGFFSRNTYTAEVQMMKEYVD